MSWQRLNIGSRVNREVHARFWEQPEVKSLRLTRLIQRLNLLTQFEPPSSESGYFCIFVLMTTPDLINPAIFR